MTDHRSAADLPKSEQYALIYAYIHIYSIGGHHTGIRLPWWRYGCIEAGL